MRNNKMAWRAAAAVFISYLGLLALGHFYFTLTGHFHSDRVLEAADSAANETADPALSQPFYFYRHGNQTFVFLSEDGRYVLKLFKKDYLNRAAWVNAIPKIPPLIPFVQYRDGSRGREKRMERLLRAYRLAFEEDKENSALLLLHLEKTERFPMIHVVDFWGNKQLVNGNTAVFALQKRAKTTREELIGLFKKRELSTVKERIRALFSLYVSGYQKGIYDKDHNLMHNTGFVDGAAVRQDVGKLEKVPEMADRKVYKKDLEKIAWVKIDRWVRDHFPIYRDEVAAEMRRQIALSCH